MKKNDDPLEQLRQLAGTQRKVLITRARPSEPSIGGFVVDVSSELVLLAQYDGFYLDGFGAFLVRDVLEVRSGEYERQWEKMLAGEGLPTSFDKESLPSVADLPSLLTDLQRRGQNVIVECEDEDEDLEDFYIGRILEIREDHILFANFDALGQWDAEASEIFFDEITRVQLETPYGRIFSKYLEGPCPLLGPSGETGS